MPIESGRGPGASPRPASGARSPRRSRRTSRRRRRSRRRARRASGRRAPSRCGSSGGVGGSDRKKRMSRAYRSSVASPSASPVDLVDHEQRVVAEGVRTPRRTRRSPCSGSGRRRCRTAPARGRVAPARRRTSVVSGEVRARRRARAPPGRARRRRTRRSRGVERPTPARRCARIALSGQALTQAMQPTQRSAMNSRDARREAAEVAGRRRAGRDDAPGQAGVGRPAPRRRCRAGTPATIDALNSST